MLPGAASWFVSKENCNPEKGFLSARRLRLLYLGRNSGPGFIQIRLRDGKRIGVLRPPPRQSLLVVELSLSLRLGHLLQGFSQCQIKILRCGCGYIHHDVCIEWGLIRQDGLSRSVLFVG